MLQAAGARRRRGGGRRAGAARRRRGVAAAALAPARRRARRRAPTRRRCDAGPRRWPAAGRRRRRWRCGSTTRATPSRMRFKHPPRSGAAVRPRHRPGAVAARPDARAADRLADEDDDRAAWSPSACRRARRCRITKAGAALPGLGRRRAAAAASGSASATMLYGLLLPSGNDAAIALAQRAAAARSRASCAMMNATRARDGPARARTSRRPSGFVDARQPLLRRRPRRARRAPCCASRGSRRSSRTRQAVLPFPIKGGKLYLYNHNPLLRRATRGVDRASRPATRTPPGRCLVATARRGPVPARRRPAALAGPGQPGAQAARPRLPRPLAVDPERVGPRARPEPPPSIRRRRLVGARRAAR